MSRLSSLFWLCAGVLGGFGVNGARAQLATPTFTRNAVVHDPSVVREGGAYYIFGSHLASAMSVDLMGWTQLSSSPAAGNLLVPDPATTFAEALAWAGAANYWAPDVHRLADGRYGLYYCTCAGNSPRSALGLAVSDSITGPYSDAGILVKSGMWGELSPDGTIYDATRHPNAIDPCVFDDASGRLWMVYGSYSGGIFILQLDPATGRPRAGQGYGRRLIGGNHVRVEGPYILYNPETAYYYLFLSFGGLSSDGGYQIRVGRATAPDGPYYDTAGNNLSYVAGPAGSFFDDNAIAPYGLKLMGNYQFQHVDGEPRTTSTGYLSPGHNSAIRDAATGKYYLVFHTRFAGRGEQFEVRVHQLYFNEQGWPVVAPHRYAGESPEILATGEIPGAFKLINHAKDIASALHVSTVINLAADGTVSGAASGTWILTGGRYAQLTINGVVYRGVFSRQWDDDNRTWVLAFSAVASSGVAVWGSKVAAPNAAPILPGPGAREVMLGETLSVPFAGSDPDFAQTLTYSLVGPPQGASINPVTGVFTWTPTLADAGGTRIIYVRATDNGADPRTTDTSFSVTVRASTQLRRIDLDFSVAGTTGLRDSAGRFTGLGARLPGTGGFIPTNDPLLSLSTSNGTLGLTTVRADFNGSAAVGVNRSVGVALSSLGFTGGQDFAVSVVFRALPTLGYVDQVGLFVGANAITLTRAGAILFGATPERYAVHTQAGADTAGHFGGTTLNVSDGMEVTLRREAGAWTYGVDGVEWSPLLAGVKNDPAFLAGFPDLTAGVYAITPFNTVAKTVQLDSFSVVVDSGVPVLTALEGWRLQYFGATSATEMAEDAADPDGDGLPNLMEYALGSMPTETSAGAAPVVQIATVNTETRLAFVFGRVADPALTYAVEAADSPGGSWTRIWVSNGASNTEGPVTVTDIVALDTTATARRFMRLRVSR
jgi:beta-xylosidase